MLKQAATAGHIKNLENRILLRPLPYMSCGSENRTAYQSGDGVNAIRRSVQITLAGKISSNSLTGSL